MTRKILIVDDDVAILSLYKLKLEKYAYQVTTLESGQEALDLLQREEFGVVLTDVQMPDINGIELVRQVSSSYRRLPVIVITSFGSMDTAIDALRAGAYDFLTKPFETEVLVHAVERALSHYSLVSEVYDLRQAIESPGVFEEIYGESAAMKQVFALVAKAARSNAAVLITGESGTGKELVARALHRRSKRQGGPFIAVNCSAMPEHLLESEFFGHEKGAFTDARTKREGLFVQASSGSVFLDEIGEMPLGLQPKILRALEEKTVRPIGSHLEVPFDARIIAATNRNLALSVEDGKFREDLYYRFNVINIHLPPLRQREKDILILAKYFLKKFASDCDGQIKGLTSDAAEKLLAYSWPGNVRELRNCMERAVALASGEYIGVGDLPEQIRGYKSTQLIVSSDKPEQMIPLDEMERRYVQSVLNAVNNNKAHAARVLGLDRKTLYRKLERWQC